MSILWVLSTCYCCCLALKRTILLWENITLDVCEERKRCSDAIKTSVGPFKANTTIAHGQQSENSTNSMNSYK